MAPKRISGDQELFSIMMMLQSNIFLNPKEDIARRQTARTPDKLSPYIYRKYFIINIFPKESMR